MRKEPHIYTKKELAKLPPEITPGTGNGMSITPEEWLAYLRKLNKSKRRIGVDADRSKAVKRKPKSN